MTEEKQDVAFLALDIETTGLDPAEDQILEIAWRAVDHKYNPIEGEYLSRVFSLTSGGLDRLTKGPEVVRQMHSTSGLLGDVLGSREAIEPSVTRLDGALSRLHDKYERIHLLGMSIHFDAEFLKANGFARLFNDKRGIHHRMYDITSIKLALTQAGVPYEAAPKGNHRALNDVDEALDQARLFGALFQRIAP